MAISSLQNHKAANLRSILLTLQVLCGLNASCSTGRAWITTRGRKKMMKALMTLSAATALTLLLTTGAWAGGWNATDQEEGSSSWTGCHLALGLGMGSVETEVRFGSFRENLGGMDANWGAGVGCDMKLPSTNLLIGVLADYTWTNLDSSNSLGRISYDNSWTVAGRVGTKLTPDTLAYLPVGYSEMDTGGLRILGSNVGGISNFSGVVVGGGLETDIGNDLRLGIEGRYYDYDGDSARFYGKTINVDPDVQTVSLRLKWQLWKPGSSLVPVPLK